ncbi:S41 family peptidase [Sphingobacterium griseoflavum]|uniref:PDZ domain-containing protein n=1 Tax=Sphingobacterium griseoflavum TaxID=1474952 RepID=A0ABQ3I297_9SPHI|nr:S41 family peptidase [Sphingobacterium griseoflavum]GHE49366.1 hypothetical protein GCM10017764_35530 [Sphingobacterium griseoflavum]
MIAAFRLFSAPRVLAILYISLLLACQKSDDEPVVNLEQQSFMDNLDSIHRYAREIYLWNEQLHIPSREDLWTRVPFQGAEVQHYRQAIGALTKTAINARTGMAYEYNANDPTVPKYSTLVKVAGTPVNRSSLASATYQVDNDFGVALYVRSREVFVLYVDQNSPAGKLNLKRGDRVLAINDQEVDNQNYLEVWSEAAKLTFAKLLVQSPQNDGRRELRLRIDRYDRNPVIGQAMLSTGGRKIGYIAYVDFSQEANTRRYVQPVFARFQEEGIDELIIDLRYNGGGYQNTAIYLANELCGDQADGQVMFTEHYNKLMQAGNATILKNQIIRNLDNSPIYIDGRVATLYDLDFSIAANTIRYQRSGGFRHLKKVHFIVSAYTASASELLINVVKPYMDVSLIGVSLRGEPTVKTYGKPVGFFDIDIAAFKLYLAMYQIKNAREEGDYFDGMLVEYVAEDSPSHDFGDAADPALAWVMGGHSAVSRKHNANKQQPALGKVTDATYIFDHAPAGLLIKDPKTIQHR